jgi:alginate O-acetyltransferase complex protein AlgI
LLFTSYEFFALFSVVFVFYWSLYQVRRAQNIVLSIGSYVFYGYLNPYFCFLLLGSTVTDFICGWAVSRTQIFKKWWVFLSVFVNLTILGVFKYFNFFVENIYSGLQGLGIAPVTPWTLSVVVPVGISFYTFQSMSYTIDVYRGERKPTTNFLDFSLYVAFFPQLVAGPIERARSLLVQVENSRTFSLASIAWGTQAILHGLVLKLVVANNVAIYVDKIFMLKLPSIELLGIGALGFAIQIYGDFFGYTLIALGVAALLGFRLSKNFNSPYFAWSPSEFWKRWHITLSRFVKDYVYISLGGSKRGLRRTVLALTITMLLMGLWHGAEWKFVVWGAYHGVLLATYHLLGFGGRWTPRPQYMIPAIGVWFFLTLVGWVIFRAPSMDWLVDLFILKNFVQEDNRGMLGLFLVSILLFSTPMLYLKLTEKLLVGQPVLQGANGAFLVLLILMIGVDSSRAFIYFQF